MVGAAGMGPAPIDLSDRIADPEEREEAEEKVMERFEKLGTKLMHRSAGMDASTFGAALSDGGKRKLVTGLLGQAFVIAYATIRLNKDATERIADRLIAEGEMYGDDVTDMLDEARLRQARDRRSGRVHMARDLIPPPSPAGRPIAGRDGGTPNLIELPPEPPRSPAEPRDEAGARAVAVPQPLRLPARRARRRVHRRGAGRRGRGQLRTGDARQGRGAGTELVALAARGHERRRRRGARSPSTSAPSTSTRTASSSSTSRRRRARRSPSRCGRRPATSA